MLRGNLEKRLLDARAALRRARDALQVDDEQLAYQQQVADDMELRAVVSATPLADRERRQADEDLRRLRRHRDELRRRVEALTAEQDELLERLLDRAGGGR